MTNFRRFSVVAALACFLYSAGVLASSVEKIVQQFANSDFVFQRSISNAAFPPLAYVSADYYGDTELVSESGRSIRFDQSSLSEALIFPWLTTQRDAFFLGEWLAWNHFDSSNDSMESFDVISAGIPFGWIRQANPQWQLAAFGLPMAHKASLDDSHWAYELMAGAFARYEQTNRLWWGFGVFMDKNPGSDLYLPYVGFSWAYSAEWTISALMPWPAIIYSPSKDMAVRLGMSPSGTSWNLSMDENEVYHEWSGWDFGITAAQRLTGNFWLEGEIGVSGLRTLSLQGDNWESPEIKADNSPFLGLTLSWRPSAP